MSLGKMRLAKGLTQEALGEIIDRPQRIISSWECGKSNPSAQSLVALFDVFGPKVLDLYRKKESTQCKKQNRKESTTGPLSRIS